MQSPIETVLEKREIVILERPQSVRKCEGCGAHIKEILKQ